MCGRWLRSDAVAWGESSGASLYLRETPADLSAQKRLLPKQETFAPGHTSSKLPEHLQPSSDPSTWAPKTRHRAHARVRPAGAAKPSLLPARQSPAAHLLLRKNAYAAC